MSPTAFFPGCLAGGRWPARERAEKFIEVHMRSTPDACARRDQYGHYAQARRGELRYFPGVDVEYEAPEDPELVIDVDEVSEEAAARRVLAFLQKHCLNGNC